MDKERKYVSDAAAEAITAKGGSMYEGWARHYGVVVLTVAEHCELLRGCEYTPFAQEELQCQWY